MTAFDTGPFVTGAFICERVLTEADGTNTYVRVVDRQVRQVVTSDPELRDLPPFRIDLVLVLMLRAGEARGGFPVFLEIEKPSGLTEPRQEFTFQFGSGGTTGVNAHINLQLELDETGVYWMHVFGGDEQRLLTRTPLDAQTSWRRGPLATS